MPESCHSPCMEGEKQTFSFRGDPSITMVLHTARIFKPALPRLCVALINSHLRQPDEARAETPWLKRQRFAQRKRARFCFP